MKFSKLFDNKIIEKNIIKENKTKNNDVFNDAADVLRNNGIKIKLITPTAFGTQIDLFKIPNEEKLNDVLVDFNYKIKNKSIFIVN